MGKKKTGGSNQTAASHSLAVNPKGARTRLALQLREPRDVLARRELRGHHVIDELVNRRQRACVVDSPRLGVGSKDIVLFTASGCGVSVFRVFSSA